MCFSSKHKFGTILILLYFKYENKFINIMSNKKKIGYITTIKDINSKSLRNDSNIYFSELYVDTIKNLQSKSKILMPSQYPTIERDISILISKNISYNQISDSIYKSGGKLLKEISLFDLYLDNKIDNDKHSLSISLLFSSKQRTLKDNEIDILMNKILKNIKNEFQIIQR